MNSVYRSFIYAILVLGCLLVVAASITNAQVWRKRTVATGENVGINPLNPNTIYAERTNGVLSLSRDRGKTWSTLPTSPPLTQIRHIFVHPKDTMTIFAVDFFNGLWRTTNEGGLWSLVLGSYGIDGESMDFDHQHPDTMFAGNYSDGNVFRSLNRGATWTLRGDAGANLCALTVNPSDGNIILTGSGASTISKSTDAGATWTPVHDGGTAEVPKIVYNPADTSIAYATTYGGSDAVCDVWKTTDGGNTWFKTALQQRANWSLAIDVQHPDTIYVGWFTSTNGAAISRSTDGGASFLDINTGLPPNFSAWNLRVHPLDASMVWVAGTQNSFGNDGVYRLFDGNSTTQITGNVRETGNNNPVVANLTMIETGDVITGFSAFTFNYFDGDPTLTPTVHVTADNHSSKDTMLTFVLGTTQNEDIHLDPLPPNSINGMVFNDLNGNNQKDPGEPGISNWKVFISGPVNTNTMTDVNGAYYFSGLTTGAYTLSAEVQSGWLQTYPVCPSTQSVSFTEGTDVINIDFGDEQFLPGAILLQESFTALTFPPPCWSIFDANGGSTWFRATTNNHTDPGSARNGFGSAIDEGKHDDWLFSRLVHLQSGQVYRLSWWDRTFIFGNQPPIDSLAVGISTSQTPGGVVQIIDSRGFNTNLAHENIQKNFTVTADGDYYIGFHDFSASGNTLRVDDVVLSYVQPFLFGTISGKKFNDKSNNGVDDDGAVVPNWKIRLSGAKTDSTYTDINGNYFFNFLPVGNYTVSEAVVAGWAQTFPPGNTYNVSITGGDDHTGLDFGNFHPNKIIVRKLEDQDGDFTTTGDRTVKAWYLYITQGVTQPGSSETGTLTVPNLTDGKYFVHEADSTDWIHLGYILNGAPVVGTDANISVSVIDGQTATVDFVNAPPIYSKLFRTATMIQWALDPDKKGNPKPIKAKPDSVHFKLNLVTRTDTAILSFSQAVTARLYTAKNKAIQVTNWSMLKKITVDLGALVNIGDTIQIEGTGFKGKAIKLDYSWSSIVAGRAKVILKGKLAPEKVPLTPGDTIKLNQLLLPMPNLHNVGTELFTFKNAFSAEGGLLIGQIIPDSVKKLAWVLHKKYADVQKSLNKKGMLHQDGSSGFLFYDNSRPMKGQLNSLPPDKQNNELFAQTVALGMNIAASDFGQMPSGLGDLIIGYSETAVQDSNWPVDCYNLLVHGMTIRDYYNALRKFLTDKERHWNGQPLPEGSPCYLGAFPEMLKKINRNINGAFSGPNDTSSWGGTKVQMTGVTRLIDVPYLHANPSGPVAVPLVAEKIPGMQMPTEYALHQNYPNPFNPTTTIQFALPEVSMVTLKVYNVLGQEVASLLNHEMVDEGNQEVVFDASHFSSGVYFYRLTTEPLVVDQEDGEVSGKAFTTTRKMLLVR